MSLRTKPTRVSGKNPAYMSGDYPEMRQKKTQQDLINEGKKFKFSVLKKPYMSNLNYQEMEYEATPLAQSPFSPNAMFPKFKGLDGVPLISGGDIANIKPWPCTCGGACTGGIKTMNALWKEVAKAVADGRINGYTPRGDYSDWTFHMSMESFIRDYLANEIYDLNTTIAMSHQCQGTGIELADRTLICGGKEMFGHLASTARGDYQEADLWLIVPFPSDFKCTTRENCACWYLSTYVDCGAGFTSCASSRDIYISTCAGITRKEIKPSSSATCSALTIVDEDGSPATDTILRNGSLDFKTTGDCCGEIQWTVSPETGGTTISAGGLLTAGATACGSLQVTATCPACGTSATQYVRVTNAGHWVDAGYCTSITGQFCLGYYASAEPQEAISGQKRKWARWGRNCWHEFEPPCVIIKTCDTIVPNNLTLDCKTLLGYIDLPYEVSKQKWEC